jgi:hypothetical protein
MTDLLTIKKLFMIYFTTFPYNLYNSANSVSNFGLVGVSYSLIHAQQNFWIANIGSIIFIYNIKNTEYFYCNMVILIWCLSLYVDSFNKALYGIKYY